MLKKEDLIHLSHLVDSLNQAYERLEYFYVNKKIEEFKKMQEFIVEASRRIDSELK